MLVCRGPRGDWLKALRDRLGPLAWEILNDLPAPLADLWIRRVYVPFEASTESWHAAKVRRSGKDPVEWDRALNAQSPDPHDDVRLRHRVHRDRKGGG